MSQPEIISSAVSDRICNHMNKDHQDAVLLYAQYFGGLATATAAQLLTVDHLGMDLLVQLPEAPETTLRIPFQEPLADSKAAHVVLVEMMKEAQGNG